MKPRGVLVVFEGIDGSGKSTQAARLTESLRGRGLTVVSTREPTQGPWGQLLRASAKTGRLSPEDELHAFIEDRRQHVTEELEPALAAGAVVVLDRYYFSTAAYQGVRGQDPAQILRRNEEFAPKPDLLVVVEMDVDAALSRIRGRDVSGDLFEKREDLAKCAEIFAGLQGSYIYRVDGGAAEIPLAERILARVTTLIEERLGTGRA